MSKLKIDTLLQFFKTLANENRLKIVGLLTNTERSVEELASLLNLTEPTVSHHLKRLKSIDLVTMTAAGNTHLYALGTESLKNMSKEIFSLKYDSLAGEVDEKTWDQRVLKNFTKGEKLVTIPASRKKRLIILKWLVEYFEKGVKYSEKEISDILKRHFPDYATLRRELVINKLMKRDRSIYQRVQVASHS